MNFNSSFLILWSYFLFFLAFYFMFDPFTEYQILDISVDVILNCLYELSSFCFCSRFSQIKTSNLRMVFAQSLPYCRYLIPSLVWLSAVILSSCMNLELPTIHLIKCLSHGQQTWIQGQIFESVTWPSWTTQTASLNMMKQIAILVCNVGFRCKW